MLPSNYRLRRVFELRNCSVCTKNSRMLFAKHVTAEKTFTQHWLSDVSLNVSSILPLNHLYFFLIILHLPTASMLLRFICAQHFSLHSRVKCVSRQTEFTPEIYFYFIFFHIQQNKRIYYRHLFMSQLIVLSEFIKLYK